MCSMDTEFSSDSDFEYHKPMVMNISSEESEEDLVQSSPQIPELHIDTQVSYEHWWYILLWTVNHHSMMIVLRLRVC